MNKKTSIIPIVILGILFFIFGFITWLNGTLIPYLKIACELNNFQSLLVAFAFYIAYFVMALPSSWLLKKTSLKKGMMIGLAIMAIGALVFVPAAMSRTYYLFLSGLFIIGTGLSVLQTASNPYITIVGPIESAAKRISIMGICNKIAGVIAPIIMGAIILSNADEITKQIASADEIVKAQILNSLASKVILPYTFIAISLALLAVLVRFSPLPEIDSIAESQTDNTSSDKKSILQIPSLILGVIALFLYVGVEVIAGDTIGSFGVSQGIPLSEARNFTSLTLSAMVLGYIAGIFAIPKLISQSKALAVSAVTGFFFSILAMATSGYTAVFFIAMLGLSNALMWPAIWPLAINGLGKFTKTGSALLIMAIAGGAILPLLYGKLADIHNIGQQIAYIVMPPCYAFIFYYAIKGYRIKKWT